MQKWVIRGISALVLATTPAMAASPAETLAKDSYQFLVSHESLLDGAIRSGQKDDYKRFIWNPTMEFFRRWPSLGDAEYDRYRRCQFALDSFRVYSEDQFNAAGKLQKTALSAKDYFEQKDLCKRAIAKIRKK